MRKLLILLLFPLTLLGQSQKISDMTSATSLTGSEYVPIVQTTNKKSTVSLLRGFGSYGTAGQYMTVNGTADGFTFVTPPFLSAYPGAGIAVSTGSAWGASITDNSANWNAAFSRTYSNGLTLSGGAVKLGGALTENVISDGAFNYNLGQTTPLTQFNVNASVGMSFTAPSIETTLLNGSDLALLQYTAAGLYSQISNILAHTKILDIDAENVSISDLTSGAGFYLDSLNSYIYGGTGGLTNGSVVMSAPKTIKGDADTVRFTYPYSDYTSPDLEFEIGELPFIDYSSKQIRLQANNYFAGDNQMVSRIQLGHDPVEYGGYLNMYASGHNIQMDSTLFAITGSGAQGGIEFGNGTDVTLSTYGGTGTLTTLNMVSGGSTYTDGKTVKDGIKYAAIGYETDNLSLVSRYYVTTSAATIANKSISLNTNTITGTKANFNTALSDGDFLFVGDVTSYTDELAQDAVGAMVDASLTYVDGTPLLQRAALTGAVTATAGSNTTALGSFTLAELNTATSDANVENIANKVTALTTMDNDKYPTTASLFARRDVTSADAIVQSDNGKTIWFNSGSPFNFTLDALTANSQIGFINKGAGTVTFVNGSGVTLSGTATLATDETAAVIYDTGTTPRILSGGAGGAGDFVGPASSVDGEAVVFDGTTGKLGKRPTGSAKFPVLGLSATTFGSNELLYSSGIGNTAASTSAMTWDGTTLKATQLDGTALTMGTGELGASRAIAAAGSASDVGITVDSKGNGNLTFNGTNTTGGIVLNGAATVVAPVTTPTEVQFFSATTNAPITVAKIVGASSGTAVAGFGSDLVFRTETGAANAEDGTVIESLLTDATGASEDFDVVIKNMTNGATATEKLRVKSTGQLQLNGYTSSSSFSGTAVGVLQFDASGNIITDVVSGGSGLTYAQVKAMKFK